MPQAEEIYTTHGAFTGGVALPADDISETKLFGLESDFFRLIRQLESFWADGRFICEDKNLSDAALEALQLGASILGNLSRSMLVPHIAKPFAS